jgi:hypothetical protein
MRKGALRLRRGSTEICGETIMSKILLVLAAISTGGLNFFRSIVTSLSKAPSVRNAGSVASITLGNLSLAAA